MNMNPFESPNPSAEPDLVDSPKKSLWTAYFIAPAVAPISFVVTLFLVCAIATAFQIEVNPASLLVLPLLALTVGMVICYVVAGVIGMPIAFYLRKRNILNGYTIHGAAFCWSVLFALVAGIPLSVFNGASWYVAPGFISCLTIPFVLLSATCFWLVLRRSGSLTIPNAK